MELPPGVRVCLPYLVFGGTKHTPMPTGLSSWRSQQKITGDESIHLIGLPRFAEGCTSKMACKYQIVR